nr:phosphatidylinositol transfer protein 2-like [Ipomoea batatas]
MYIVMKMLQQNSTGNEGVEILENKSFDDDEYGQGQYTSKIYRFHSKVPSWLTAFAPANALATQEEAWNAYPMCKTVSQCPFFSKLRLTIDTIHKADNGHSENNQLTKKVHDNLGAWSEQRTACSQRGGNH